MRIFPQRSPVYTPTKAGGVGATGSGLERLPPNIGFIVRFEMPRLGKRPPDVPANPNRTYADQGWKGFGDWFGTGRIADKIRVYRSFDEARTFVHRLRLKSHTEWNAYCKGEMTGLGKLPADIPSHAHRTYADQGWKSVGDWLGSGTIAARLRVYLSFSAARSFVRKLKLKSSTAWNAYCKGEMAGLGKLPADIPKAPWHLYADKGWESMGDWLGKDRPLRKK